MAPFEPVSALAGGVLIGCAVGLLWLLTGRVGGISGIFAGALTVNTQEGGWRWLFLAGLVGGAFVMRVVDAGYFPRGVDGPWLLVAIAGCAVGLGTRLGGGCTSGHGVCGIARLSPRSVTATMVFTLVAGATVLAERLFS